jgi:hypothetical protein
MGTPQNVGVIGVAYFPERARPQPVVPRPVYRAPRPAPVPYNRYRYDYEGESSAREADGAPKRRAQAPSSAPRDAEQRADAKGSGTWDDLGRSGASVNNLGTEYGESRDSSVTSVSFERASKTHPAFVSALRYDDAEGLMARGIDVDARRYARYYDSPEPQPFPAQRFAQPPPR